MDAIRVAYESRPSKKLISFGDVCDGRRRGRESGQKQRIICDLNKVQAWVTRGLDPVELWVSFRERVSLLCPRSSTILLCISLDLLCRHSLERIISIKLSFLPFFSFPIFFEKKNFEATKLINQRDRQSGI